jgi:hypothetical protein
MQGNFVLENPPSPRRLLYLWPDIFTEFIISPQLISVIFYNDYCHQ